MVPRIRQANFWSNYKETMLQLQMRSDERELMKRFSTINQSYKKSSIIFQSFGENKMVVAFFTDFACSCDWLQL